MPLDVPELITGWMKKDRLDSNDLALLRRLTRKAEISRRLMTVYNDDFVPVEESLPLAAKEINLLMLVLLRVVSDGNDLRFLNSALKIADGILLSPAYRADIAVMRRLDEAVAGVRLYAES